MTASFFSRARTAVTAFGSWSAHPTRSLLIFATGAAIGLGAAGFSLFTAKGAATRVVPPEDVALVNQRPILLSDFNAQLEAQYAVPLTEITPAERRATLNDMIREELFVQRGLELDMPSSDPDTRTALVAAVEQQVGANVTAQKLGEDQLRAWYDAHRDTYASEGTMTLRDMVTPPGGGVAKDSGRVNGEEFYFAVRIHLGPALFDVARNLRDGAVSAPVVQPDGTHVIVMIHNSPPVPRPFAQAEARVEQDMAKATRDRVAADELKSLREKADILITPRLR